MSSYKPGSLDAAANSVRAQRVREREKREANRPTGTEIGQISQKLQTLTAQLAAQQTALEEAQQELQTQQTALQSAQTQLAAQQTDMERRTPDPEGQSQTTASATATTTATTIHSYSVRIPSGKNKAFISLSARASTSEASNVPVLELYEDSTLVGVMTVPALVGGSSVSFTQTVSAAHSYTVRLRTLTGSATVTSITSYFTVIYFV